LVGFLHSKERRTATGRALVITADALTLDTGYTTGKGLSVHSKIRVRVTPDNGGSEFESDAGAWGGDEEHLVRGHWTYVLYDPEQPDGCDVDSDRLGTEFGRVDGKKRRTSVPKWVSDEWTKQALQPGDDQRAEAASSTPHAEPAPAADSPPGSDGLVADLKDLAQLHAAGALSDAEYADAKSRLLAHG
jgi:Short C-terminal domain